MNYNDKTKVLQILIPNGNPNGLKIIEINGWVGKCFITSRQYIKDLKDRSEINQPGIYFLFGIDEDKGEDLVYIGESENFFNRIMNHDSNKDFWDHLVVFTGQINRADVKYLEYRATVLAGNAKRMKVQNKVQPQENTLSEFQKVSIDQYFENIRFILNVFQYQLFESIQDSIIDNTLYFLVSEHTNAEARLLESGELLVLKKSTARIRETDAFTGSSKNLRNKLIQENKFLIKDDDSYELQEDIIFKSPSSAAATLMGRPANGWTSWKDSNGISMDENLRK